MSTSEPLSEPPEDDRHLASLQKRGENVAFAVESVLTCFATDFIDPVIGQLFQRQHAYAHGHAEHGTMWQNVVGEVGGDIFSAVALIGAEEFCPKQMREAGRLMGDTLDPAYRLMAQTALKLDFNKEEDRERYAQWREYQQDNLARSAVMGVAGIAGNVGLQKMPWINNPSPASVIFKGKLLGVGITTGLVIGSRLAFPKATKKVDAWLATHAFAPVLEKTDKWVGRVNEDEAQLPSPGGL
jgi:hypothetical protein